MFVFYYGSFVFDLISVWGGIEKQDKWGIIDVCVLFIVIFSCGGKFDLDVVDMIYVVDEQDEDEDKGDFELVLYFCDNWIFGNEVGKLEVSYILVDKR